MFNLNIQHCNVIYMTESKEKHNSSPKLHCLHSYSALPLQGSTVCKYHVYYTVYTYCMCNKKQYINHIRHTGDSFSDASWGFKSELWHFRGAQIRPYSNVWYFGDFPMTQTSKWKKCRGRNSWSMVTEIGVVALLNDLHMSRSCSRPQKTRLIFWQNALFALLMAVG